MVDTKTRMESWGLKPDNKEDDSVEHYDKMELADFIDAFELTLGDTKLRDKIIEALWKKPNGQDATDFTFRNLWKINIDEKMWSY